MLDGAQRMIAELKSDPNRKVKSDLDVARSHEVLFLFKTSLNKNMNKFPFYPAGRESVED